MIRKQSNCTAKLSELSRNAEIHTQITQSSEPYALTPKPLALNGETCAFESKVVGLT